MSFAITKRQFLDGSKTQTRRLGWIWLKVGDRFMAVDKCMGLKPGQHPVQYGACRVTRIRRERLDQITQAECVSEGFPEMTPAQFVELFCRVNKCEPSTMVTVIDFERVPRG